VGVNTPGVGVKLAGGVLVGVFVGVLVGVSVGVLVGVLVGVFVGVLVGVGVQAGIWTVFVVVADTGSGVPPPFVSVPVAAT